MNKLFNGLCIGLVCLLSACSPSTDEKNTTTQTNQAPETTEKVYVVGSGATYRPFEFEAADKTLQGFDIDLIRAIAAAENMQIKIVNTPWEGIFATLDSGDRDILISGITITDARKQSVAFSNPYFPAEQVIVVPEENTDIQNIQDLKSKTVGVVNSSTADVVVSEVLGKNSTSIRRFDNTPLMLQELYESGIDAAVGDVGVAMFYIKSHPERKFRLIRDTKFDTQYFGIAVAKTNQALQERINRGLKTIIEKGEYAKIYQTWFEGEVPVLPTP